MKNTISTLFLSALTLSSVGFAQDQAPQEQAAAPATESKERTFEEASQDIVQELDASTKELASLREQLVAEKLPLSKRLNDLQADLSAVRSSYQSTTRLLDTRTLDLSNLRTEIQQRKDQSTYLTGLLSEYTREFATRLHSAERNRFKGFIEASELAPENSALSGDQIDAAQLDLVIASVERLEQALGGTRFQGTATDAKGAVHKGNYVLVGPVAYFGTADGSVVGVAEQRLNSLGPAATPFFDPLNTEAALRLVRTGQGVFPLDPTLGKAHKIEATQDSILDEVRKGGAVMYPIFGMAALALALAIIKWLGMLMLRKPSKKKINALLDAVEKHDSELAVAKARAIRGPVGRMLTAGAEHLREPRELIEEVMYEVMLTARLKLQRFLPFIAICAASAPLLGLLGTVTGIIKTFKIITVFGSGDVKTLSDGISEALITTKFGLVVAIPSLLLHAFLSRKARGVIGNMETSALAFVNKVSLHPRNRNATLVPSRGEHVVTQVAPDPNLVRDQVNAILSDMLSSTEKQGEEGGAEPLQPTA